MSPEEIKKARDLIGKSMRWAYDPMQHAAWHKIIEMAMVVTPAALDEVERLTEQNKTQEHYIQMYRYDVECLEESNKKLRAIAEAAESVHERLKHIPIGIFIYGVPEATKDDKILFDRMESALKAYRERK